MTLTLIICAWLLVPAIAIWAGVKLYVPWFRATHRERAYQPADELAARRNVRAASGGSTVLQRLRLR